LGASVSLAASEQPAPHVDTYVTPNGTTYFAMSVAPSAVIAQTENRDVVILFDTSASQTSLYRDKGLESLETLLAGLNRSDRVQLLAVDLDTVPLTEKFVAPQSAEMDQALVALKQRAPLGATDMPAALRSAAALFSGSTSDRVVLYIGDGMSTARFLELEEYRKLINTLADLRLPVSSFAVGPRLDTQLLASLANQTGGMLVVDGESIDAKQAGAFLALATRGAVAWPRSVAWPQALAEVYPRRMPPLRSDRDTIVVGKAAAKLAGELKIAFTADAAGKLLELDWTLDVGASNPDYSFLASLVEASHSDDGLRLISLGTAGLNETRRLVNENTQLLAKLSGQAMASGNLDTAERLALEALRRDPQDETAQGVKKQVAKLRAAAKAASQTTGDKAPAAKTASEEAASDKPVPPAEPKTSEAKSEANKKPAFQAFAVPDDLRLGPQAVPSKTPAAKSRPKAAARPAAPRAAPVKAAAKGDAPQTTAKAKPQVIDLKISAGDDPEVVWNDYFAAHPDVAADSVRETVRQRMRERKGAEVIGMLKAALRNGKPQPWMYEVLSLAMQLNGNTKAETERALMSAVDFGDSAEDLMYVAQYMARSGLETRALKVFRQVSMMEPLRPEPYLYGLQLAQQTGDIEGLKWSSLGILKQAWPKEKQDVVQSASRSAASAIAKLKANGQTEEAKEFQAQLDRAKVRDCIVKVTWTGEADVDLLVQEPSGSVASFRNPRTAGGGIIVGDAARLDSRGASALHSETYECPEAFNGNYQILVRRVWGKVTAGKVTVDLYAHQGTPQEKHLQHQIPLGEQDALVTFDLAEGRRQEPLADHLLANAAAEQATVNSAILAQQVGNLAGNSSAGASFGASRQGMFGVPFVKQAVGYMPIIITLPTGGSLSVNGVVSADRRYVRISPFPFFSQVGSVTTFNIASGSTGTTQTGGGSAAGGSGIGSGGGDAGGFGT
jgi:hypothetical protein